MRHEKTPPTALAIVREQLEKSRAARFGALVIACFTTLGIFADMVAADLPVLCRVHGHVYVLANVARPKALSVAGKGRLAQGAAPGDFALGPLIHFGPELTDSPPRPFEAPSVTRGHWLGTDARGRDVLARLVHGTRASLGIGLIAVVAFVAIGVLVGSLAGFYGGLADALVTRVVETLSAFPTVLLVLVVQAILERSSIVTMVATIVLTRWTEVAQLVRAEVQRAMSQDYIVAARALGASPWRVLQRHVLPNAVVPAIVAATLGISSVVLIEATVDFLGVGNASGAVTWGEILSEGRSRSDALWLFLFPGATLLLLVVALNLFGEALRDALDPRLRDAARSRTTE